MTSTIRQLTQTEKRDGILASLAQRSQLERDWTKRYAIAQLEALAIASAFGPVEDYDLQYADCRLLLECLDVA